MESERVQALYMSLVIEHMCETCSCQNQPTVSPVTVSNPVLTSRRERSFELCQCLTERTSAAEQSGSSASLKSEKTSVPELHVRICAAFQSFLS